jgi:hypothetical protein
VRHIPPHRLALGISGALTCLMLGLLLGVVVYRSTSGSPQPGVGQSRLPSSAPSSQPTPITFVPAPTPATTGPPPRPPGQAKKPARPKRYDHHHHHRHHDGRD